ncbi:MAG TPA: phosphopantetheine-binding protein [Aliidongia sp.]|uniref:phosphopantetheine-binding protein n=1 Tax=Aliidongia sp. TaxID=1914230 RepID=UPI002DDCC87E|nr:phosphopantetheine-binding protein [Aliidongia sp.]HEV2673291.1 phosphopantetheine-binding protein [Aliidongia sp.]
MIDLVIAELQRVLAAKDAAPAAIGADTVLLDGDLPIDSLDLATLVVALEEETGREPFKAGFRMFKTVGELAALFEAAAS